MLILLVTLPQGLTTTKEYAEIEFTGAVWMGIVWVAYGVVFFTTLVQRRVSHLYVGNWFFGAFILVIAMLHVVNHLAIPVSWFKSYSIYAARPTPWCSGGTATTPWASSSPPASSG